MRQLRLVRAARVARRRLRLSRDARRRPSLPRAARAARGGKCNIYIIYDDDADEDGTTSEHERSGARGHGGDRAGQLDATENDRFPRGAGWDMRGTANTHTVSIYLHSAFPDMVPWFQEPTKLTVRPPMFNVRVSGGLSRIPVAIGSLTAFRVKGSALLTTSDKDQLHVPAYCT